MEATVDHSCIVFCCVYAVQHGPSEYEHSNFADGPGLWVE